jgi:hypothetical protein
MSLSSYRIAFSLNVYHTYFQNDVCTCVQFNPTTTTCTVLNKYGFKMRERINGFDFFFNTSETTTGILDYITKVTGQNYFEFTMTSTNGSFPLFTDISTDRLGQLLYDSQSKSNQTTNGVVVLSQNISPSTFTSEVGRVKIYYSDISANGEPVFEIRLNARSTQWQYYVVNKSSVPLDSPAITGKPLVRFEDPVTVTIPSGQSAIMFSSGNILLPLSEVPKYKFDLVNSSPDSSTSSLKKTAGSKVIFKGLPNPDPSNTRATILNGKKEATSLIYIYV